MNNFELAYKDIISYKYKDIISYKDKDMALDKDNDKIKMMIIKILKLLDLF
jgi:hypothetical protein